MDGKTFVVFFAAFTVFVEAAWQSDEQRLHREMRRGGVHYHSKRHMLPTEPDNKRRPTERQRERDIRKKPSGHLAPLQEDDMDNDEVVSVAIGPPPMRPKYDKLSWKHSKTSTPRPVNDTNCSINQGATNVVKDVLSQLGRELLSHQVSEDFIFGQYVGNAMKNLTSDLKLKLQHEILEIIVRYQKANRGEMLSSPVPTRNNEPTSLSFFRDTKEGRKNETADEAWPDFSNLAKIVG